MNTHASTPLVVGLAGAIGAGKTTVAQILTNLGMHHIDFDRDTHAALEREDVKQQIKEQWGDDAFDSHGNIDRRRLAKHVFSNQTQRELLESIIHPIVWRTRDQARDEARVAGCPAALMDAPLLFEVGLNAECDRVIFVDAPRSTRLRRVAQNRGWSEDELNQRESTQLDPNSKRDRADHIIENDGSLDQLTQRVMVVYSLITGGKVERSGSK